MTSGLTELSAAALHAISRFQPAPPDLMIARSLQQRVDRKFVLPTSALEPLLASLHRDYYVLRAGQQAWARYESLYFDTPERLLFDDHRRGRRPRYKVRIRHHLDRRFTFLEIKQKENGDRTVKARLAIPFLQAVLGSRERRFIEAHSAVTPSRLVPCISIAFLRATLVNGAANERLTLDVGLRFDADQGHARLPRVAIAEVKQPRHSYRSGAVTTLRALGAREQALSKYCLGSVLLAPVRANLFKPALLAVARLSA